MTRLFWGLAGIGIFFLIWQTLAWVFHEIVIASPSQTFYSLGRMVQTSAFWKNVFITVERFGVSLFLGSLGGFAAGLAAGLNAGVRWLLEPLRWCLMTMPPVILVVVGMIWFGMGNVQTIFVTALLIMPIVYINTIEGIEAVDTRLLEMGTVYRAHLRLFLEDIYLPGIGGHVLAGLTIAAGLGIRIVILAELLGAHSGIGHAFALARINLDTPALFAWVIVSLTMVGVIDLAILQPVRKHLTKWK